MIICNKEIELFFSHTAMKRLVIIDSHALIHRAYHALPVLTSPAGEPVHAVYGFTSILLRIIKELKPDYIAAAFDLPGPTFRHVAYERYKAQRPETASDLASQFPKVRDVLEAFRIPVFFREGYEADDIVGTIVHRVKKEENLETIIVTGDMDALQLVGPRVRVYTMRKSIADTVTYDAAAVRERYGFPPERVVDYKALKGDTSDNIAGVKGIGEKTAGELIKKFGSIDGIYNGLKKKDTGVSASVAAKLAEGKEDAYLSRELATIRHDVPIDFSLETLAWHGSGNGEARAILTRFGFVSLLKRLDAPLPTLPALSGKTPRGQRDAAAGIAQSNSSNAGSGMLSFPAAASRGLETTEHWKQFAADEARSVIALVPEGEMVHAVSKETEKIYHLTPAVFRNAAAQKFFAGHPALWAFDHKSLIRFFAAHGARLGAVRGDLLLSAYIAQSFARDFSYAAVIGRERGEALPGTAAALPHFFEAAARIDAKLNEGALRGVYENIELPLPGILAAMEARGILLDRDALAALGKKTAQQIAALTSGIHAAAGGAFNINSSQQLSRVLFETLGIGAAGLRKTEKGGVTSTRESELVKLKDRHPVIEKILQYRELAKLTSTYIDVLPDLADAAGRVHTTFNQAGTATGRLSSANPNLQNIPVMSEAGREIRKAFVAKKGFALVSFDYSQIELRVAAHMAQDEKMIAAFRKGQDIHTMTAAEIYDVPPEQVTPELRRAAKTLNFGVLYGMGPNALAEGAGMDREDAKKFISEYFREFAGIRDFIEHTKRMARERGYVESLYGRRRYIPEILSSNPRARAEAERAAVNMPIQGTATGDIIKMALIAVDRRLREKNLEEDAALLLQVHDELVFEIREKSVKTLAPEIRDIMEGVACLAVPLVVDVKSGPNWGSQAPV